MRFSLTVSSSHRVIPMHRRLWPTGKRSPHIFFVRSSNSEPTSTHWEPLISASERSTPSEQQDKHPKLTPMTMRVISHSDQNRSWMSFLLFLYNFKRYGRVMSIRFLSLFHFTTLSSTHTRLLFRRHTRISNTPTIHQWRGLHYVYQLTPWCFLCTCLSSYTWGGSLLGSGLIRPTLASWPWRWRWLGLYFCCSVSPLWFLVFACASCVRF